jgi:aerobic-type carbon monoxide dehydrogenase small subunit (CoxS/CutS family)
LFNVTRVLELRLEFGLFVFQQLDIHMSMNRKGFSVMVYTEEFLLQMLHEMIWKWEHMTRHDQECLAFEVPIDLFYVTSCNITFLEYA